MATTAIGPIGARQINNSLYVGRSDLATIQSAVTAAASTGGLYVVVIPFDYAGSDTIAAITGGTTSINILDLRQGQTQMYAWNGSQFAPSRFQQAAGFVASGQPPAIPQGSASMYFAQNGTAGAGTAHIDFTSNPATGMPSLNFNGVPANGNPFVTFMRMQASIADPLTPAGIPQIEAPAQLGLFNDGFTSFNLWTGQGYVAGNKGMTVWARAAQNVIDLQGLTIGGNYDQAIRLNYLGGAVYIGPLVFDGTGNLTGITNLTATGAITAGSITAGDSDFTTCEVANSPVRTFANTPDGPGQGMVWPPDGIAVSLGDHWQSPSIDPATIPTASMVGIPVSDGTAWQTPIDPATLPRLNTANTFTAAPQTMIESNAYMRVRGNVPAASIDITHAGLTTSWNLSQANGETSFINVATLAGAGAFGWYNTWIGGSAPSGSAPSMFLDSHGSLSITGAFTTRSNVASLGTITSPSNGLMVIWNLNSGTGETDFINSTGGAGGGFSWYNAAPGTTLTGSSVAAMRLDSANSLNVLGDIAGRSLHAIGASAMAVVANSIWMDFSSGVGRILTIGASATTLASLQLGSINSAGGGFTQFCGFGMDSLGVPQTISPKFVATTAISQFLGGVIIQGGGTGPAPANNYSQISVNGSTTYYDAFGSSPTVQGDVFFRTVSSNGTVSATVLHILSTGITVTGTITGTTKNFLIPHPIDKTKNLVHSCLEGPEIGVYYRGEAITANGAAEITLPAYFEALTRPDNRSVFLTQIFEDNDEFAMLQASRVKDGKFRVRSSMSVAKFYWQVIAVRADVEPLEVESAKLESEDNADVTGTNRIGEGEARELHPSSPPDASAATAKSSRTRRVH